MSYKYGLQVTKKYTYICARVEGRHAFRKRPYLFQKTFSAFRICSSCSEAREILLSRGTPGTPATSCRMRLLNFSGAKRAATFSRVSMASFLAAMEAEPHCGSRASRDASSASSIHSSIIIAAPATRAHRKMSLNFGYSFIQRYMEARAGIAGSSQIFRSVSPLARRRHIFSARAGEYRDGRPVFFFPVSVFLCFLLDKI